MSIDVHVSPQPLSAEQVRSMPRQRQSFDWSGVPLPHQLSWAVAIDPTSLWFVCSLPGGLFSTAPHSRSEFKEGLWNEDVAEIFIMGQDGRYQELNLAPSGAWWSMTLTGYRERQVSPRRPVPLHISTDVRGERWEVVAAFSLDSLEIEVTSAALIHVSGMWYSPQPNYLSSHPAVGVAPDYHHPECFQPISLLESRA